MARLLHCFSSLIRFGLTQDAATAAGRPAMDGESARRQALALLERARVDALALGRPAQEVEQARFAMVAWLDEVLARLPGGDAAPAALQVALFNSSNAQSEFFHHLSALAPDDDEVREIYWQALALGFKGQYYFEEGDGGELGKLKDLHARQLRPEPLALDSLTLDHITPQPYSVPDPPGPRDPQSSQRAGLRVAGALALLLPLAYLLWFGLASPPEPPLTLARRVELQLQGYACADLAAAVAPDGSARISGFVADEAAQARVESDLRVLPGLGPTSFDLHLRAWPLCEVVALLKPYQVRNRDQGLGLAIASPTAARGRLREGDKVLISVTNANNEGYLWVDYYTADGSVLHLNAGAKQPRLRAGEVIELGRTIPASWLVAPPFGTVMVSVLASPRPFAETADRPAFELASAYLQRLREMLVSDGFAAQVAADYIFLETEPR